MVITLSSVFEWRKNITFKLLSITVDKETNVLDNKFKIKLR